MAPPIAGKHIIVAGAGISGLTFAHAIEKFWPSDYLKPTITLCERGSRQVEVDREGYSLSIRSEETTAGLQVLQKLGVLDNFLGNSLPGIYGGKAALLFRDAKWKTFGSIKPPDPPPDGLPVGQMRVMRPLLRQHLIDTLPASIEVLWNTTCTSAARCKSGRMEVAFGDGSIAECDLLIAADGASSKIRDSILPSDQPGFISVVCIVGISKFPDGVPPEIHGTWGPVLFGEGTGLFVFDIDHKSASWQISYLADEPRQNTRRADLAGYEQELLDEVRERGKAFAQPFGQLIDATDLKTLTIINARDKHAINHGRLNGMPMVFVGDANHAITPFSGSGANMALMDGFELAKLLSDPAQTMESAIKTFDENCAIRSKKALSTSRLTIKILHSEGWRLVCYVWAMRVVFFFGRLFGNA